MKRYISAALLFVVTGLCLAQVFVLQRRPTPAAAGGTAVWDSITNNVDPLRVGATYKFTNTIPTLDNGIAILMVVAGGESCTNNSAATCDGVAMTKIVQQHANDTMTGGFLSAWYLVNPTAGAREFIVTFNSSPGTYGNALVAFLSGVNQSTPISGTTNYGSSATTNWVTVQTTTGDMAMGFFGTGSGGIIGYQTVRVEDEHNETFGCGQVVVQTRTGDGGVVINTSSGGDWCANTAWNVKHN